MSTHPLADDLLDETCPKCTYTHDSSWTQAINRFDPNTPTLFRASHPQSATRATRAEAEADMCAHKTRGRTA